MMMKSVPFILLISSLMQVSSVAFQYNNHHTRVHAPIKFSSDKISSDIKQPVEPKPCFYKRIDGLWRQRKQLNELSIGQRLFAVRRSECDYIDGVTGPKVFLECGVCRLTNKKGRTWDAVNGMMRLGKRTGRNNRMKESVVQKKLAKLPDDALFPVYVSKINLDHGSFEVCLRREDAVDEEKHTRLVSASSLKPGQELSGYVKDIHPYGVFIDVGANRKGLLHITKVARHYDTFIDKEEGLKKIGLKQGAKINVVVAKNERKRLEFDYPSPQVERDEKEDIDSSNVDTEALDDSYVDLSEEEEEEEAAWASYGSDQSDQYDVSDEEAAMWAAYADYNPNYQEDDDDDPDEDREIEDALGIGSW